MNKELNKWQIGIKIRKRMEMMDSLGWSELQFYILKLTSFPKEGYVLTKNNFDGFRLGFMFWLPIDRLDFN